MAKLIFPFTLEKAYDTGGHTVVHPLGRHTLYNCWITGVQWIQIGQWLNKMAVQNLISDMTFFHSHCSSLLNKLRNHLSRWVENDEKSESRKDNLYLTCFPNESNPGCSPGPAPNHSLTSETLWIVQCWSGSCLCPEPSTFPRLFEQID